MSDYFDLDGTEVEVSPDEDLCKQLQYANWQPKLASVEEENNEEYIYTSIYSDICVIQQERKQPEDPGYSTLHEVIPLSNSTNIRDHHSYHGVLTRKEANALLLLAPKRGYITRYSDSQDKYILSVAIPTPTSNQIEHFMIAIDTEVPSYALKGSGKSFPTIEELLEFYERTWINSQLGTTGRAYTQIDTTLWWKEYEMKKRKEMEKMIKKEKEEQKEKEKQKEKAQPQNEEQEVKKLEVHNEQDKLKEQQEQLLQMQADMAKQQMMFQQQVEELKKGMMEPLVNQQKEYQQQILELQKANKELLQTIQKREQTQHRKCSIQ